MQLNIFQGHATTLQIVRFRAILLTKRIEPTPEPSLDVYKTSAAWTTTIVLLTLVAPETTIAQSARKLILQTYISVYA